MAIVAASTAAFTQLIKPVVNEIFIAKDSALLYPIALATITVFTLRGFAAYSQAVLMSHVGHRVVAKIQQELFDKLIGADLAFFHHSSPGTLISHFIRSEEHTSELQSLMRISYAVFCLKKKNT